MAKYVSRIQSKISGKRGLDYRPVFASLSASGDAFRGCFCFDKRMLLHTDVKKEVKLACTKKHRNNNVSEKIKSCRKVMSQWKKKRVFNAKDKIHLIHERLEWFQSKSYPCTFVINRIKKELILAYKEEEMYWNQKSRDQWLVLGDRNSKFFHSSIKTGRSRKHITKLKDDDGNAHWSDAAKAEVATAYFSNLFKSSNPRSYAHVFQSMLPKVTQGMNGALISDVSKEEVREAIFLIQQESVSGPDGMTAVFFQKYWEFVGDDITREIQQVFASGYLPAD